MNAGDSDIYLGTRSTLPAIKLSLHASGEWHVAFDQKYFLRKREEGFLAEKPDRWIHRWNRPKDTDCYVAFRVIIPAIGVIAPIQASERRKDVVWIDAPDVPLANFVALVICPAGCTPPATLADSSLARTDLSSGDQLLLCTEVGTVPKMNAPSPGRLRHLVEPMPDVKELAAAGTLRAIVPGADDAGVPFFLDVAVAPNP